MSSATTNPDVNLKGLSDSPVGSMMVAEALWICSGSLRCRKPLCRSVVCRIFTRSRGLQAISLGIKSSSFSTKLSWKCGSSVMNSL
uniref:Uncharacterized protein n=1 Tax=Anguilla anguilla TaxID=7936 RepID=A0A0E9TDK2_ANGAN